MVALSFTCSQSSNTKIQHNQQENMDLQQKYIRRRNLSLTDQSRYFVNTFVTVLHQENFWPCKMTITFFKNDIGAIQPFVK